MAIGAHRDQNGEISQKHGNTLIRELRTIYGPSFAKGRNSHEKLSDVLANLDEVSLSKLMRDYEARLLDIRLKTSPRSPLT
jgi:hypothetical protein